MNEHQLKDYTFFWQRNHFQINAGPEMLHFVIVMRIPMQETKSQESDVAA